MAFNIGTYFGIDPTSPQYAAALAEFEAELGILPTIVDQGIDYGQPMSTWVAQTVSEAGILAASPGGTRNTPVLSVPMMDKSGTLTQLQAFEQIASGADDSIWAGMVAAYKAEGFTTLYLRPGWEMNGDWFPWSVYTQAEAQAYIAAFDRIAVVARGISGITVQMVWTPDTNNNSAIPTADMYPGDSYVDVVGLDFYDVVFPLSLHDWSTGKTDATLQQWWANPVNLAHYWDYPGSTAYAPLGGANEWGMVAALTFAVAHGKPFALPETGNNANGTSNGPPSDPYFPQYLAQRLLAVGAPSVAFVSIWDKYGTQQQFTDGADPAMAASWAEFVKKMNQGDAGPTVAPGTVTIAHGQTTNLAALLDNLILPGRPGDLETISDLSVVSGAVALGVNGAVLYQAGAGGTDAITYTVTDQFGDSITATTNIAIDPGPTLQAAAVAVGHGAQFSAAALSTLLVSPGLAGDTESLSNLTATSGTIAAGAGGTVFYTAPASGTDIISARVTDQLGDSVFGTARIVVDPGPKLADGSTTATPGESKSLTYFIEQLITPGLSGDTETITAVSASSGSVSLSSTKAILYTASAGGTDIITYTVEDELGDTATGTYVISVGTSSVNGKVLLFGAGATVGVGDPGVAVSLLNAAGAVVATATSTSSGYYSFNAQVPGAYRVEFTPPPGQAVRPGGTLLTPAFTVASGATVTAPQGALIPLASLNGQVLLGRVPGAGVAVALIDGSGAVVASTTTNGAGTFTFIGLAAGAYKLRYTAPSGEVLQPGGAVAPATGLSTVVTLAAAQAVSVPAVVLLPAAGSITGAVMSGGAGQPGVVVTFREASGLIVATTTTDAFGNFIFFGRPPGSYVIGFRPPAGEALQSGGLASPATGLTPPFTLASGGSVTLPAEILVAAPATLTGRILVGTAGVAGVTVNLLSAIGALVATTTSSKTGGYSFAGLPSSGYVIQIVPPAAQVLVAGGSTQTLYLSPGETLALPVTTLAAAPASISGVVTGDGVTVALLNAAGHLYETASQQAGGAYRFSVPSGTYRLLFTTVAGESLSSGPANPTTGLTAPFTVASGQELTVATEAAIANAGSVAGQVTLAGVGESGVGITLLTPAGVTVATATTDTNGDYLFSGLTPASYRIQYAPPAGDVLRVGGPANAYTGLTAVLTVAALQAVSLAPEQLLTDPGSIAVKILHFGGATDPVWGSGDPGVTVSLLDPTGDLLTAPLITNANGYVVFHDIGAGSYKLNYALPAGQAFQAGFTATTAPFSVAAGQSFIETSAQVISTYDFSGTGVTDVVAPGAYVVTGTATNSSLTLGAGNQQVTITGGGGDTIVTGNGNETISVTGAGNSITVGTGVSTINAGGGDAVVHASGTRVTVTASDTGNLFDGGTGLSFFNTDGSADNVFMLNPGGASGVSTISGFNVGANDVLQLARTLAGTAILPDLSNLGKYITATTNGANTQLSVDPTGSGGAGQVFAVLQGLHTSVAALQAAGDFALT